MKKSVLILTLLSIMTLTLAQNPFFEAFQTPHATAPFHRIRTEHFEPAMREAISLHNAEIDRIVNNAEAPTFENTLVALDESGAMLERVAAVFSNLLGAETNDSLQQLAQTLMPLLNDHGNSISLNERLFERISCVYAQRDELSLTDEQRRLLDDTYQGFVRGGANLSADDKEKYRALTTELSKLTLQYDDHDLAELNAYQLVLTDSAQLAGLPESAIEAAAQTAREKQVEGWVFTLDAPSYVPFMTYADCRDLRQQLYIARSSLCCRGGEYDNRILVRRIVNLRMRIAHLLGYQCYADYVLEHRMAENTTNVYHLLNQLIEAYLPKAQQEVAEVEAMARSLAGDAFVLMPWDWSYYSNKLKEQKYHLDDEMLRPYFELSRVKEGVFGLATRLYGLSFKRNADIPVYHPDVEAYEVFDADSTFLAVLYTDFHPRAGKQSGAWMTGYKEQWRDSRSGENSRPHISLVMNFTKPTPEKPALLTFDEVETFLHEFGHALHGMLANTTYRGLSGTNVYRDFVELPSQIMENFAVEKEFLHTFARHYRTGELIPDELVQRIVDAGNFNCAYACLRQVSFGLLDMAWYTRTRHFNGDVKDYEKRSWQRAQLLPQIDESCMSTNFSHIFSGGYSAGYYGYKWAEVLDADAFARFKREGIFNADVAKSFRDNILSKGGTEHPMKLYVRFRGAEPTINALLERNGIKQ